MPSTGELKPRRYQPPPLPTDTHLPFTIQSTRCKSSISSLLISTFTTNNNTRAGSEPDNGVRVSKGGGLGLRGFGCTAQPQVQVPGAMIRSSADWVEDQRKLKKKKRAKKGKKRDGNQQNGGGVQDVCCAPGIGIAGFGLGADDCVVATRRLSVRGKIDVEKGHHRERPPSYSSRQAPLDLDPVFDLPSFGSDVVGDRYYHHFRNRSAEELAEIMMFQNGLLGRRSGALDRFDGWRLDVDHMSYEELLELGDRIGYVSTGLLEEEIRRCIGKIKFSASDNLSPSLSHVDRKCSICQEEYETEDEMGKLSCGHVYHTQCIKQWLTRRNACPVCKLTVASR
ncbi:putative E3 ubiquitin-protein ligase RHG1A [Drosera capensis]